MGQALTARISQRKRKRDTDVSVTIPDHQEIKEVTPVKSPPETETKAAPTVTDDEKELVDWIVSQDRLEPEKYQSGLGVMPDVLGFKFVRFWFDDTHMSPGAALLWLQIPQAGNTILESQKSDVIVPAATGLKQGVKYRTGKAQVIGVQFVGLLDDVKKMTLAYLQDTGILRSNHDRKFTYEVETVVEEPKCQAVVEGCGHGIHFFTDLESARQYWHNQLTIHGEWPVITRKLRRQRQAIASVTPEFVARYLDPKLQLTTKATAWSHSPCAETRHEFVMTLVNRARAQQDLPPIVV